MNEVLLYPNAKICTSFSSVKRFSAVVKLTFTQIETKWKCYTVILEIQYGNTSCGKLREFLFATQART